jgi:hypothetical protein
LTNNRLLGLLFCVYASLREYLAEQAMPFTLRMYGESPWPAGAARNSRPVN